MTDALLALAVFAVVMSVTPGPNVLMVMASAANHGFRATVPHQVGIALGFPVMIAVLGLGAAGALAAWPSLHLALKWIGAAWLLVLSWKIATAGEAKADGPFGGRLARPIGFFAAAGFQWVNPKAWGIALSALAVYTVPGDPMLKQVALIAIVFVLACLPCTALWAAGGVAISRLLSSQSRRRTFNWTMGALCAASVVPMLV
jgi:threonine/homoserine/homoserine lactone efflux protein